jgi:hypothetical protein
MKAPRAREFPPVQKMLSYFEYEHLPTDLRAISAHFHDLAHTLSAAIPSGAEATTAIRKLLEAKDCAVRAALDDREGSVES